MPVPVFAGAAVKVMPLPAVSMTTGKVARPAEFVVALAPEKIEPTMG